MKNKSVLILGALSDIAKSIAQKYGENGYNLHLAARKIDDLKLHSTDLKIRYNIDIDIYKDAHHSFDRKTELKVAENGYKFTDCRFKLRNDGAVLMNFLNIPMTNPFLQKIGFAMCAGRNPSFGGHKESRRKSFEFSKDFMKKNLMD